MEPTCKPGSYIAEIVRTQYDASGDVPLIFAWFRIENSIDVVRIRISMQPGNHIAQNKLRALLFHGNAGHHDIDRVDGALLDTMLGHHIRVIVKHWRAPDGREIPVVDFVRAIDDDRQKGRMN